MRPSTSRGAPGGGASNSLILAIVHLVNYLLVLYAAVKGRQAPHSNPTLFLLSQVGAHVAQRFAQRIAPLGITPPHSGILRALSESAGLSQQQLATRLNVHPSRLVALVDELESKGLAERRQSSEDRRTHALQLTDAGRKMIGEIGRVALKLQSELCAALSAQERETLGALLGRIAAEQGLVYGVHPGFGETPKKQEG